MRSKFFSVWIVVILFTGLSGIMSVPSADAAPSAFKLLLPADKAEVQTKEILDWEDSTDSDLAAGLTYTLYLSENVSFSDPIIKIENLSSSIYALQETDGIKDVTTYYWKVEAINDYGDITASSVWHFNTKNTNAAAAMVGGYIFNSQNQPIANATVTIIKWGQTFTFKSDTSGYFLGKLETSTNPGEENVTLEITADGYDMKTVSMQVVFDEVTSQVFTLAGGALIGDIDNDGKLTLKDAVLVLRVLKGESSESIKGSVTGGIIKESLMGQDKVVGLAELVYILQELLKTS